MTTQDGSHSSRGCRLRSSTSRNRSDIYTAPNREFRTAEREELPEDSHRFRCYFTLEGLESQAPPSREDCASCHKLL
jgi:hypothetical protein